mgnify:CR=1 FL=1
MNNPTLSKTVDHAAIRVAHLLTIVFLVTAFILDSLPLVIFVAAANGLGALIPSFSLFNAIYTNILKPAEWVKPDIVPDHPEPHRFAQGVGAVCVVISAILLANAQVIAGWAFSWLVIFLAAANVFLGFCAGCFTYYQLNRLGVPGFQHRPMHR